MMGRRIPLKSGAEHDALTRGGRRVHGFKARTIRWIKRKFGKRARREAKRDIVKEPDDA